MSTLCIIPARMASGRFPGKPLEPILGLPLVLHIYQRCRRCALLDQVVIATCDQEIRSACEAHGAETVMTSADHPGCVDRTEEAVQLIGGSLAVDDTVVMVQGDEILVTPDMLDRLVEAHVDTGAPVTNLVSRIHRHADHDDPNVVKAVAAPNGTALYFSRAPVPSRARAADVAAYQQTGVIGFTKAFLGRFGQLERTPLEMAEHIDMLRVLEHGLPVGLVRTETETLGIDTPADRDRAEDILRQDKLAQDYLAELAT